MYRIFVNHKPIAKKRHRTGNLRGRTVTYDPQSHDKINTKFVLSDMLRQEGLLEPLEGPINIKLVSYDLYPKSWSKKAIKTNQATGCWKTTKPDVDNYVKFYLDVLNGIAYKDDAQIVKILAEKKYSDKQGIEIKITKPGEN